MIPENLGDVLREWSAIKEDIAFLRALRRLNIATAQGDVALQYLTGSDNALIDLRGLTSSGEVSPSQLPAIESSNDGQFLTNDGAIPSWTAAPGATLFTSVSIAGTQSISNAAWELITFDTEGSNDYDIWAAGEPTKLTVPTGQGGLYLVSLRIAWNTNNNGQRMIEIAKDGAPTPALITQDTTAGGEATYQSVSTFVEAAAASYFQAYVYQNSTAALNVTAADFRLVRIGN